MSIQFNDDIWRKDFNTADELLLALSPWVKSAKVYGTDTGTFVFRGQANEHELIPSAWRERTILREEKQFFSFKPEKRKKITLRTLLSAELGCVKAFLYHADRGGLSLPEDGAFLRANLAELEDQLSIASQSSTIAMWPPMGLQALFGLAQHHGIPTRLLDFSWNPFIAAYFCVESLVRRNIDPCTNGLVTVWIINNSLFCADRSMPDSLKLLPFHSIQVPTASNHNLKAQDGLFICRQFRNHRLDEIAEMTSFTDAITAAVEKYYVPKEDLSPFYRFSLPRSETPNLLRLLSSIGVSATRLYPGYEGAKRSYDDDEWLDRYT